MRKYLGFGLLAAVLILGACGTSAKTGSSRPSANSNGGTGSSTGGAGSFNPSGGSNLVIPPEGSGGIPADADPSNPNITHPTCGAGACLDFPAAPIVGEGVPANAAALFGDPANFTAGSLCALEPQLSAGDKPGAMLPANWVRPRFRVMAPAGIDVLEIRIHSPAEKNDLVAYTAYKVGANGSPSSWYLPREVWSGVPTAMSPAAGAGLANNAAGQPVTVTIAA